MQYHFSQNLIAGFNDRRDKVVVTMYKSYYPEIISKVSELTGGSSDTLDLASEIFTRILENKGEFKTVRNLENFIEKVIISTYNDEKRKKETREKNVYRLQEHYKGLDTQAMENSRNRRNCQHLTYIATEMLPAKSKEVYLLAYVYELSNRQIAQKLGISERTVENHKNTAYKKLRLEINNRQATDGGLFWFIISIPLIICYLLIQKLLS